MQQRMTRMRISYQLKRRKFIIPQITEMGQWGSLSQNKSLILSNWTQATIGSNIIFNKVTNQQIQRHQLVINDKNRLLSYTKRMQHQSDLICRLIYFHPKISNYQYKLKNKQTKINTGENTCFNRPKSMISQTRAGNQVQQSSATSIPGQQQIHQPKIYCIYTDRMIPIKEWNKDKIIDVITAFKKLTKLYGKFKVRQHCICENQRKQIKVWINQNPVSNFPVQSVQTEQDMIADFASVLVSKKQKIAKQLLDIQFFDEAIDHFSNLTEYDQKKYLSSGSSSNTASYRQSNVPIPSKQTTYSNPFFQHSPQLKNIYNLYTKTDNTCSVNSTTQNAKFKVIAQTNFGMNRQPSIPNFMQIKTPNHFQTPQFCSLPKDPKSSNQGQVPIKSQIKSSFASPKMLDYPAPKNDNNYLLDNTSIMIHGDQSGMKLNTNFLKTQKNHTDFNKVTYQSINQVQKIRKKESNANFNIFQNQKLPKGAPKFISSTTHDINNRQKNNSSCDIRLKKVVQGQQVLENRSLIYTQKKQIENISSINQGKDYFSSESKPSLSQNLYKTQTASIYHHQKPIEQGRFSECQRLRNYQQQNQQFNKNMIQDKKSSNFTFVKPALENDKNKMYHNFETHKKGVLQIEVSSNMTSSNPVNGSQNKKSFPKYFHDKKMAKSIQKTNEKSTDHKTKQNNLIMKTQYEKSPRKDEKPFGQQKFEYRRRSNKKSTINSLTSEVIQAEPMTKQLISSPKPLNMNENLMRVIENYEPRRKFPSTMEYNKSKKVFNNKQFQDKEFKKQKLGEPIDSPPCYTQSWEVTRQNFMSVNESSLDQTKLLKTSNNFCEDKKDKEFRMKGFSYFKGGNANDLTFGSGKQQFQNERKGFESEIKKRTKFESIDNTQEQRFKSEPDEIKQIQTLNRQQSKAQFQPLDSFLDERMNQQQHEEAITENIDESNRKMTFPNYNQANQNSRKNDKQFTFFNPSQKPSAMHQIGQNSSFQQPCHKNRVNVFKKVSFNQDEKQTLPRTTTDEREKRMFKATRQSEALVDINDLHSSDPGHRIQQIVDIIEKEKQKDKMNHDDLSKTQQKADNKQNPVVKKWEPTVNIYASWVKNSAQKTSFAIKKKDYKMQKNKINQNPQIFNQIEQQNNRQYEDSSRISSSQNLQSKKKIRKEVLMDYKDLFGDQPPLQKQETAFEKERARKLQMKRIREEEEKLFENTSGKDLLIQEKVQKQKQKHAQLKNDLSKLFSDGF